jgi:hypothetical protein
VVQSFEKTNGSAHCANGGDGEQIPEQRIKVAAAAEAGSKQGTVRVEGV